MHNLESSKYQGYFATRSQEEAKPMLLRQKNHLHKRDRSPIKWLYDVTHLDGGCMTSYNLLHNTTTNTATTASSATRPPYESENQTHQNLNFRHLLYLKSEESKLWLSLLVSFLMLSNLAVVLFSAHLAALSIEFDSMLLIFSCLMEKG